MSFFVSLEAALTVTLPVTLTRPASTAVALAAYWPTASVAPFPASSLSANPAAVTTWSTVRVLVAERARFGASIRVPVATDVRASASVLPNDAEIASPSESLPTSVRIVSVVSVEDDRVTVPSASIHEPVNRRTCAVGCELA